MANSLTKYRHIIWDWNGTLLDDAWLVIDVVNEILRKRGKPEIDHSSYQDVFDVPVIGFYERVGLDFSVEPFETVAVEFITNYDKQRFRCKLQQGAKAVLKSCAANGLSQSILSAYQQHRLKEAVKFFQIDGLFTKVVGPGDHYAVGKIENGKNLLAQLDIPGEQVLVVGDMVHDFEVAKAIGADCVLIPSGHHRRSKLQSSGAPILDSITQVPALLS